MNCEPRTMQQDLCCVTIST